MTTTKPIAKSVSPGKKVAPMDGSKPDRSEGASEDDLDPAASVELKRQRDA